MLLRKVSAESSLDRKFCADTVHLVCEGSDLYAASATTLSATATGGLRQRWCLRKEEERCAESTLNAPGIVACRWTTSRHSMGLACDALGQRSVLEVVLGHPPRLYLRSILLSQRYTIHGSWLPEHKIEALRDNQYY